MDSKLKAGLAAVVAIGIAVGAGLLLLEEGGESPDPRSSQPGYGQQTPTATASRAVPPPTPTQGSGHAGTQTPSKTGASGGSPTGPTGPQGPGPTGTPPQERPGPTGPQGGGPVALSVICEDGTGAPLPGVSIEARRKSGMPLQPVQSNAEGRASLGGLPEGELISGVARHARVEGGVAFGPVRVHAGASLRIRLNLARLGRLVGVIRDQAGNPVREAEVVLVNPKEPDGKAILDVAALGLGADGSFVTQVAAGNYAVSARGPGFSESDRAYVVVPADGDSSQVELRVSRKASITGQLNLPPDVAQLRPLELDVVIESESGTARNPLTRTDRRQLRPAADLTFKLEDVHAGRVRIRVELPRAGDHRVGPWSKFDLKPGQQLSGVLVSLAEVTVAVRGTVRDDRGAVIPNVDVSVGSRQVKTDLQGAFVLRGLDMGETGVEASLKGHARAYQAIDYQGSQLTVDLVLARLGEVQGRVTGSSVNGIPVVLFRSEDGAVETHNATTDAQGGYLLTDIPPGTYHLKAGKGADPFDSTGAPTVQVKPGERAQANPITR